MANSETAKYFSQNIYRSIYVYIYIYITAYTHVQNVPAVCCTIRLFLILHSQRISSLDQQHGFIAEWPFGSVIFRYTSQQKDQVSQIVLHIERTYCSFRRWLLGISYLLQLYWELWSWELCACWRRAISRYRFVYLAYTFLWHKLNSINMS